jgi:hypothetical protein
MTVFFGLGVFAANAWLREDLPPRWAWHLDTNPRSYLRRSLRYLARRR